MHRDRYLYLSPTLIKVPLLWILISWLSALTMEKTITCLLFWISGDLVKINSLVAPHFHALSCFSKHLRLAIIKTAVQWCLGSSVFLLLQWLYMSCKHIHFVLLRVQCVSQSLLFKSPQGALLTFCAYGFHDWIICWILLDRCIGILMTFRLVFYISWCLNSYINSGEGNKNTKIHLWPRISG